MQKSVDIERNVQISSTIQKRVVKMVRRVTAKPRALTKIRHARYDDPTNVTADNAPPPSHVKPGRGLLRPRSGANEGRRDVRKSGKFLA